MTEVLVCWSGGCDSTLLLHHAARLYGTPKNPVRSLSISSSQVTSAKREAAARKRILREFKKRGLHIDPMELELNVASGSPGLSHHGLPQAVMWLLATQALNETETLALGYIKGDDWLGHREAYQTVFDTLQKTSNRTGTLWTPLWGTEKRAVLHQLAELNLLHLTWWCDVPHNSTKKTAPCGSCASCLTHRTAQWKLAEFGPPNHYWHGNLDGS